MTHYIIRQRVTGDPKAPFIVQAGFDRDTRAGAIRYAEEFHQNGPPSFETILEEHVVILELDARERIVRIPAWAVVLMDGECDVLESDIAFNEEARDEMIAWMEGRQQGNERVTVTELEIKI